jgi:hypothetical protein
MRKRESAEDIGFSKIISRFLDIKLVNFNEFGDMSFSENQRVYRGYF